MNYLFFEDNVYPLYAGNTYQMGSSVDSNIYLPCLENIMLDVKETEAELLGNRITDNTVCKYISCIAANIQTISFINPILRVKDQNIGTAVYTIREIIHDEYIAAGKIAKDPELEIPEELSLVSEDPMNRGE